MDCFPKSKGQLNACCRMTKKKACTSYYSVTVTDKDCQEELKKKNERTTLLVLEVCARLDKQGTEREMEVERRRRWHRWMDGLDDQCNGWES